MPKATHTHTTPQPIRTFTRRTLALGGAAAAIGITAGTAAGVATVVAPSRLLGLCGRYHNASARYYELNARQAALSDPEKEPARSEWERLDDLITDVSAAVGDLEEEIARTPARDTAELHAKARVLLCAVSHGRNTLDMVNSDQPGALMAFSLARDLAGGAA